MKVLLSTLKRSLSALIKTKSCAFQNGHVLENRKAAEPFLHHLHPKAFTTSLEMPPKRKAALQAPVLETESPSPPKKTKATRGPAKKPSAKEDKTTENGHEDPPAAKQARAKKTTKTKSGAESSKPARKAAPAKRGAKAAKEKPPTEEDESSAEEKDLSDVDSLPSEAEEVKHPMKKAAARGDAEKNQLVKEDESASGEGDLSDAESVEELKPSKTTAPARGDAKNKQPVKEVEPLSDDSQSSEAEFAPPAKEEAKSSNRRAPARNATRKPAVKPPTDDSESDAEDAKPSRKKATAKPARVGKRAAQDSKEDTQSKTKKATAKSKKTEKAEETKPAPMNVTETKWDELSFGCDKKNSKGESYNLKITSWNVDGLRAWLKKGGMQILNADHPDIFCLQETKCSHEKLPEDVKDIEGYHDYWVASEKDGYAGVGVYTKLEPLEVTYGIGEEDHDADGRCITLEYPNFFLVNVYVPNAGRGLVTLPKRLEWNQHFKAFIKKLDQSKPVIVCGDMNVAHNEIDLTNPKNNKKNAGFTQEERDGMTDFLEDGYVDTFRDLYPDMKDVFTFWSYMNKARSKNVGWRLDYFILSKRIMDNVCDSVVRDKVYGSDHCPISLFLNTSF